MRTDGLAALDGGGKPGHADGRRSSAAPARTTAGVAFHAGAVADEREISAFAAAVAFAALEAGSGGALAGGSLDIKA